MATILVLIAIKRGVAAVMVRDGKPCKVMLIKVILSKPLQAQPP
jgi:hypothetical protein